MPVDDEILREAKEARDRLIAAQHDVDAARADYHHAIRRLCAAGGSMREIAEALGLSHQRVHQIVWQEETGTLLRPRGPFFARAGSARFEPGARSAAAAARDQARALGNDRIEPVHVLLGLIATDGQAVAVLGLLGVTPKALHAQVEKGPGSPAGELPLTEETKKLFERAVREAIGRGHGYLGTEHLLLAFADSEPLRKLGVAADDVRAEVKRQSAA